LTYLGKFISNEIVSELVNQSDNQKKFEVIGGARLNELIRDKKLPSSNDAATTSKGIGDALMESVVIFGEISDFGATFRVNLRLFSSETGNEIASIKVLFQKSETLINYHDKKLIPETQLVATDSQNIINKPIQQPKNCPTGDFCFENTSKKRKVVEILGAENAVGGHEVLYTLTIPAGEKACFYNIPAVVHNIAITTDDPSETNVNTYPRRFNRPTLEYRQIKVINCASEDSIKPMKL
ncbi:MAG: hypothetical protein M3N14_04855, partial [Bacteroidota bacterium]|nr:hypothetical protein [Bacteroidota bacterium]